MGNHNHLVDSNEETLEGDSTVDVACSNHSNLMEVEVYFDKNSLVDNLLNVFLVLEDSDYAAISLVVVVHDSLYQKSH